MKTKIISLLVLFSIISYAPISAQTDYNLTATGIYNATLKSVLNPANALVSSVRGVTSLKKSNPQLYKGLVYCMAQFFVIEHLYADYLYSDEDVDAQAYTKMAFIEAIRNNWSTPEGRQHLNVWVGTYKGQKNVILSQIKTNLMFR